MALSKPKSVDLSVGLTNRYFYVVFQKHRITVPEDASWNEMDEIPQLNAHAQIFQEVTNMLFEIAHLFKNARVEELVKNVKDFVSTVVISTASSQRPSVHYLTME